MMLDLRLCSLCRLMHVFAGRKFLFAVISFSLLSMSAAHALLMGEVIVKSRVGEPLLAYIPISLEKRDVKIDTGCLSLIKTGIWPERDRQSLTDAKLDLEGDQKNGQQIKIFTTYPVNSRFLIFQIKASCPPNALIIREFRLELEAARQPFTFSSALTDVVRISGMQKPDITGSVRGGYFSSSRKLDDKTDLGVGSVWLKGKQNFGENASLVAEGWVRNDDSFRRETSFGRLREGYVNYSAGNADFRIGKQIIVWGRADRLNPTDNLTPRNFTLLTPEDDDQRMGAAAALMTYHAQETLFTGIWLPGVTPNVIPIPASPGMYFTESKPHANQFALKVDRSGGAVDWSASYFNGLDINPDFMIGAVSASATNIVLTHNRIHVFGMDAATVVGRYGLRAEAAYTWTSNTGVNDFLIKKPFFYMVAGGDRTFFESFNINLQYYLRHVSNYSDPQAIADPLLRGIAIQGAVLSSQFERFQHGASIRLGNKWFNETLEGEVTGMVSFGRPNYFLRPKVVYAFSDHVKGSLGLDVYRGESNSFFGQLRKNSLLFTEMKYGF